VEHFRSWRTDATEGIDTDRKSAMGTILMQIMESFAELERSTIGERVRAGVAEAKRHSFDITQPATRNSRAVTQQRPWNARYDSL
jgi:DNA invertase Pin-like site-specific DNA recombinase